MLPMSPVPRPNPVRGSCSAAFYSLSSRRKLENVRFEQLQRVKKQCIRAPWHPTIGSPPKIGQRPGPAHDAARTSGPYFHPFFVLSSGCTTGLEG